jgi:predicted type IV restriction endonuclease
MDFKAELQHLSTQITERKAHVTNEEMTKQALIIPLLQKLGFDVFNPLEVRAEFTSDFGNKKGEKVDYAIFKNGSPIIFIEAKSVNEKLDKHDGQLSRYFNATPEVKIGILTNGLTYKFYTDLNQNNIMDERPFFEFHVESANAQDVEVLETFTRDNFNPEVVSKYAEEIVYLSNLNSNLKELFSNPSDDFLRFLIKDFSNSRITSNVLDRFRPIVIKAINNTLLEIIREGLSPKAAIAVTQEETAVEDVNEKPSNSRIVTTEEELQSFEIIKEWLAASGRDLSKLNYKDTTSYFAVYNRVITNWFMRINLDAANKYIAVRIDRERCAQLCPGLAVDEATRTMEGSRIRIQSIEDLHQMRDLILAAFDEVRDK